eukprot:jgi/Mesen1/7380/ME000382S06584
MAAAIFPVAADVAATKKAARLGEKESLLALEPDHLVLIFQLLPAEAVLSVAMTCRRVREVAQSDAVWSTLCKRDLEIDVAKLPDAVRDSKSMAGIYKDMMLVENAKWHRLELTGAVPKARASHSIVASGGNLVLYGGGSDGGRHLEDTWVMDAAKIFSAEGLMGSASWQAVCEGQPKGRFQQSCTVVGSKLVLFGGINDFGTRLNDTWTFRLDQLEKMGKGISPDGLGGASWQQLEVAGAPAPRGAHAACIAGDEQVVMFGGIAQDGQRMGDTWLLDTGSDPPAWREIKVASAPSARSGHTLTKVGVNQFVLYGGRGAKVEVLSDVWLLTLDGERSSWVKLVSMDDGSSHRSPGARAGHSATPIFGGRVLIFGGEDGMRGRKCDVWLLDPRGGKPAGAVAGMRTAASRSASLAAAEAEPHTDLVVPELETAGDLQVVPSVGAGTSAEGTRAAAAGGRVAGQLGAGNDDEVGTSTGTGGRHEAEASSSRASGSSDQGGPEAAHGRTRCRLWRAIQCSGEVPSRRAYHGACALAGGCGVCVFGGMVDGGEAEPRHNGHLLSFSDQFHLLQLPPF